MAAWMRIDSDCCLIGWVSELTIAQRGAWLAIMCAVKMGGKRGAIPLSDLSRWMVKMDVPCELWEDVLTKWPAEKGYSDGVMFTVANWSAYQRDDATNAERQAKYREAHQNPPITDSRNASNAVTESESVTWDGRDFCVPESVLKEWCNRWPNVKREAIEQAIKDAAVWYIEKKRTPKLPKSCCTNWLKNEFQLYVKPQPVLQLNSPADEEGSKLVRQLKAKNG